jgi:putative SOS response-associated peptidase YedK
MAPAPDGTLRLWPVSRAVNNVRNHGPQLLTPLDDPGPQTLEEAAQI